MSFKTNSIRKKSSTAPEFFSIEKQFPFLFSFKLYKTTFFVIHPGSFSFLNTHKNYSTNNKKKQNFHDHKFSIQLFFLSIAFDKQTYTHRAPSESNNK